jgi:hypothetical protein
MKRAVADLQDLIRARYPASTLSVFRAEDDEDALDLIATIEVEDLDAVMDLVIDRVLACQLENGVLVHVVPVRPIEQAPALN